MHWEMAETMHSKDREELDADIDRLAGKIGMFSILWSFGNFTRAYY